MAHSLAAADKLVNELLQSVIGVPVASGNLRAGQALDQIGPQRLVLTVGRVAGSEKELSQIH